VLAELKGSSSDWNRWTKGSWFCLRWSCDEESVGEVLSGGCGPHLAELIPWQPPPTIQASPKLFKAATGVYEAHISVTSQRSSFMTPAFICFHRLAVSSIHQFQWSSISAFIDQEHGQYKTKHYNNDGLNAQILMAVDVPVSIGHLFKAFCQLSALSTSLP